MINHLLTMSNNFYDKIMNTINKGKQDLIQAKDKIDTNKLKEKFNHELKNIKENNGVNKETYNKLKENLMFFSSNKMDKINKYTESNSYWKKYYEYKNMFSQSFSLFKKDPVQNSKSRFKDFFSFKKTFLFGENKLKLIAFKFFILYLAYLGINIIYHRAIHGNEHKDKVEIMKQLQEIKIQNEEIIRRNREIMEGNHKYRGN